jgi:hypothetical protein
MPVLVLTAAEVLAGADADFYQGIAGATITAGQVCYLDSVDNRIKLADADASLSKASVKGVALHGAGAEQPMRMQTGGAMVFGASAVINALDVVVGTALFLSATPGAMTEAADVTSGLYVTNIGVAAPSDTIRLNIFSSNQPLP